MGDPKKPKKKYTTPTHPWQGTRIEEEKTLTKDYGLKNKKEIWKAASLVTRFRKQAKKIIASTTEQSKKEEKQLLDRLDKLNIFSKGAKIEDVLNLSVNSVLDRRLQTQVFKKNLARTPKQARQFIVHGHVNINDRKVNKPSYLVDTSEEGSISFSNKSVLSKEDHPERSVEKKAP